MKVSVYFIGARQLYMLKAVQKRDRKCSTTELSRPCGRHFHKSQQRFVSKRTKFEINDLLFEISLNSSNRAGVFCGALLHASLEQKADRCIRAEAKPASDDHHKIAPRTKQENSPIPSQCRKFSSSRDRGAYRARPRDLQQRVADVATHRTQRIQCYEEKLNTMYASGATATKSVTRKVLCLRGTPGA
jgi:hypothetical protein